MTVTFRSTLPAILRAVFSGWPTNDGTATLSSAAFWLLNAHLPIRIAPTRTSRPATTSRIVEVLDFFCWRRRSGRSS